MGRNKELAKNTIIIAVGKICTQFITFFLLPVYTHYLSTSEYGTVDMIITCTGLITPILSLQMERAVFRYLVDARNDRVKQDEIISTALCSVVPSILFVLALVPIVSWGFHLEHALLIGLIAISAIMSNIFLQIPRGLGKNVHYSIGSMIIGILNAVISIVATVFLHMGITGVLLANILAHSVGILYVTVAMRLYQQINISARSRRTLKELLRFSIPMIPNDISYWIISVSDRVLIYLLLGNAFNGIYATSVKFSTFLVSFYNIFNMSWMETVSVHGKDSDAGKYLSDTFNTIFKLFASICVVAIAILPFAFSIIIGADFAASYIYIPVLIFGAFLNIIVGMLSSLYIGFKKTKELAKTTALAAAINIIVNILLIHKLGIWAAVISTVAAYFTVAVYRIVDIQEIIKIKIRKTSILVISVMFFAVISLYYTDSFLLKIIGLTFAIISSLVSNVSFIKGLFCETMKMAKKGLVK